MGYISQHSGTTIDDTISESASIEYVDKAINNLQNLINAKATINQIYPIGSIYMSLNSTSPASLFGGTWEQIQGKFLLSAGNGYTGGNSGGSKEHKHTTQGHTLTESEMPNHYHNTFGGTTLWGTGAFNAKGTIVTSTTWGRATGVSKEDWEKYDTGSHIDNQFFIDQGYFRTHDAGGSASHTHGDTGTTSNLPPYLVVYMWKRTA